MRNLKGPTIREIAELAGVGLATVDRVLNGRTGVRASTRKKVEDAAMKLLPSGDDGSEVFKVFLACESGSTFNRAMDDAVAEVNRSVRKIVVTSHYVTTSNMHAQRFAIALKTSGESYDGIVVVAREHPAVNGAIRELTKRGIPVICLTTDLPSSRRSGYVGNDQYAAGSVAGQLIGKALPIKPARILLVMSAAFRCQQERELGFRRALRSDFPHLKIDDRLLSDDVPETTRLHVAKYLRETGVPSAIYNVAGANRGVSAALQQENCEDVLFVGHELTPQSRGLLLSGTMDYVISHDFAAELRSAVEWMSERENGVERETWVSPILIHTKHNCDF